MSFALPELTLRETEAKRHLVLSYLLDECLTRDGLTDYYLSPSHARKLIAIPEIELEFEYDLRDVPGFFYDAACAFREQGGWWLRAPLEGYLSPRMNGRGQIARLEHSYSRGGPRNSVTSEGLCLGT